MKIGRKTKLTEKMIEEIAKHIELGMINKDVAQLVGISETTFYNWMKEGENSKDNNIFRKFYLKVKEAEAKAIKRNLAIIQRAANEGNWQAAAWFLERKRPEDWGRKERVNINTDDGITIKVEKVEGREEKEDK